MASKIHAKDPEPTEEHQEKVAEQVEEKRDSTQDVGPDPVIAATGEDQPSKDEPEKEG